MAFKAEGLTTHPNPVGKGGTLTYATADAINDVNAASYWDSTQSGIEFEDTRALKSLEDFIRDQRIVSNRGVPLHVFSGHASSGGQRFIVLTVEPTGRIGVGAASPNRINYG